MSEKRTKVPSDTVEDGRKNTKKQKRGFAVGPQNLPDGTYRRKTQKIKNDLIQKAKIKKNYAKLKRSVNISETHDEGIPIPATIDTNDAREETEPTISPHPDRQAIINRSLSLRTMDQPTKSKVAATNQPRERHRKPKHQPFQREYSQAQKRKAEAEERRKAREEAERQRQLKVEERGRFRRAMAKARTGGRNGQRKLGRESKVLLEKVRRMTKGEGGKG